MRKRRNKTDSLQPLAPLVSLTLRRTGLGRVVLMSRLLQHWDAIVGSQLAAVAQPEGIRSQVLFITVTDAIWLQQLMFYQSQLLQNIQKELGEVSITRLHFSLASSSRPSGAGQERSKPEVAPLPDPLPLTAAEEQQVHSATESVADFELRDTIRRAWRSGWQAGRHEA